jgi:WD40 repeat protein
LTNWAKDTQRFLKQNWKAIQAEPIAVYHLFAFSPKSTIFQTVYAKSRSFPHPIVTMGLDDDWPKDVSIATHAIYTICLSDCGRWFITGGRDENCAVYGLWNVGLADGETHIHPCGTLECSVISVGICERDLSLHLYTYCECHLMCTWDAFTWPHTLIADMKLVFIHWSDDISKAIVSEEGSHYSLIRRNDPIKYPLHDEHRWKWKFSSGSGHTLAGSNENILEMWDSTSAQRIFRKEFKESIYPSQFSPDAMTIFVELERSIECVSTEDGTSKWSIPHCTCYHSLKFFLHGQKIVLGHGENIRVVSAIDGSILVNLQKLNFNYLETNPEDVHMTIAANEDGFYRWSPLCIDSTHELGKFHSPSEDFVHRVSWVHQTLVSTAHDIIYFHSLHSVYSGDQRKENFIKHFNLSPNGEYLAVTTDGGEIQIWECKAGNKLMALDGFHVDEKEIKLTFSLDSSGMLIANQSSMTFVDIISRTTECFGVMGISSATFLNTFKPPSLLTIGTDGTVEKLSCDGKIRRHVSHISFCPREPHLSISSDDSILVISEREEYGRLIIKNLSADSTEILWPTSGCIGCMLSPDATTLIVAEFPKSMRRNYGAALLVTCIKLPEMAVQSSWLEFRHDLQNVVPVARYQIHTMEINTYRDWELPSTICLDSHSGNRVISSILHRDDDGSIRYGRQ